MDIDKLRDGLSKEINDFLHLYNIEPVYILTLVFGIVLYSTIDIRNGNNSWFDWYFFGLSMFGFFVFLSSLTVHDI